MVVSGLQGKSIDLLAHFSIYIRIVSQPPSHDIISYFKMMCMMSSGDDRGWQCGTHRRPAVVTQCIHSFYTPQSTTLPAVSPVSFAAKCILPSTEDRSRDLTIQRRQIAISQQLHSLCVIFRFTASPAIQKADHKKARRNDASARYLYVGKERIKGARRLG